MEVAEARCGKVNKKLAGSRVIWGGGQIFLREEDCTNIGYLSSSGFICLDCQSLQGDALLSTGLQSFRAVPVMETGTEMADIFCGSKRIDVPAVVDKLRLVCPRPACKPHSVRCKTAGLRPKASSLGLHLGGHLS